MSKVKAFLPMTEVIGAHVIRDNLGNPVVAKKTEFDKKVHGDVPFVRRGELLWRKPKPVKLVMHFKNEAAKRRCNGDLKLATPNDVRLVPVYRGAPKSFMTYLRGLRARAERIAQAAAEESALVAG